MLLSKLYRVLIVYDHVSVPKILDGTVTLACC